MEYPYDLLAALLPELEKYNKHRNQHKPASIEEFAEWVLANKNTEKVTHRYIDPQPAKKVVPNQSSGETIDIKLCMMLTYLYRYAKIYIKEALTNTPISSPEEFSFLVVLFPTKVLKKSTLIMENIMEMPSGIEVIKRLIKLGLITESPDPTDKRARLVQLSTKGIATCGNLLERLKPVTELITGQLDDQEKEIMLGSFLDLHKFHWKVFTEEKEKNAPVLLEKYGIR